MRSPSCRCLFDDAVVFEGFAVREEILGVEIAYGIGSRQPDGFRDLHAFGMTVRPQINSAGPDVIVDSHTHIAGGIIISPIEDIGIGTGSFFGYMI